MKLSRKCGIKDFVSKKTKFENLSCPYFLENEALHERIVLYIFHVFFTYFHTQNKPPSIVGFCLVSNWTSHIYRTNFQSQFFRELSLEQKILFYIFSFFRKESPHPCLYMLFGRTLYRNLYSTVAIRKW